MFIPFASSIIYQQYITVAHIELWSKIREKSENLRKTKSVLMNNNARLEFQFSLRVALDAYHPHWESGYKGRSDTNELAPFATVTAETLRDSWVNGEHRPKPGVFRRFLEEAGFPEEIQKNLLRLYRESDPRQIHPRAIEPEYAQNHIVVGTPARNAPAISLPTKRLWISALIVGMILLLVALADATLLARQIDASEVGVVSLAGTSNQLLSMQTSSQTISVPPGQTTFPVPIEVGETVTVAFKVQNSDTHPIWIKTLGCGAQGPSDNQVDWRGPQSPFPEVHDIRLQPGETYEFRQSRAFYIFGDYFVEPVMQDGRGWGGIAPFTRINFTVVR